MEIHQVSQHPRTKGWRPIFRSHLNTESVTVAVSSEYRTWILYEKKLKKLKLVAGLHGFGFLHGTLGVTLCSGWKCLFTDCVIRLYRTSQIFNGSALWAQLIVSATRQQVPMSRTSDLKLARLRLLRGAGAVSSGPSFAGPAAVGAKLPIGRVYLTRPARALDVWKESPIEVLEDSPSGWRKFPMWKVCKRERPQKGGCKRCDSTGPCREMEYEFDRRGIAKERTSSEGVRFKPGQVSHKDRRSSKNIIFGVLARLVRVSLPVRITTPGTPWNPCFNSRQSTFWVVFP